MTPVSNGLTCNRTTNTTIYGPSNHRFVRTPSKVDVREVGLHRICNMFQPVKKLILLAARLYFESEDRTNGRGPSFTFRYLDTVVRAREM